MSIKNNKNNKQDVCLARLDERVQHLKIRLEAFINNDFGHLRAEVDKLKYLIIGAILIPILLRLFF